MPPLSPKLIAELETEFPTLILRYDVPWEKVSTLGVGGEIPLIAEPADDISLAHLLKHCGERNIRTLVLGGGSNMAGSDSPCDALVIKLRHGDFIKVRLGRTFVTAGAGVRLHDLITIAAHHGLGGAAPIAAIPGTVGGALRMNAGARGASIGDLVMEVCGLDAQGNAWCASGSDIKWSYRDSAIPKDVIITAAIFKFQTADADAESSLIREELKYRSAHDPKGRSAGCIFRNPSPDSSAGQIIDACGLKGSRSGGALVSPAHANYIINDAQSSEQDFLSLACSVKKKVFNMTGIQLKPEICFADPASAQKLNECVSKLKITVLKGGTSSEREVSLESGGAVAKALREAGCEVTEIDIKEPKVCDAMRSADTVFPVLHGGFGESGELQKVMEEAKLKFVGCGSKACGIIIDKLKSKDLMDKHGIPTPAYAMLTKSERSFPAKLKLPVVVKPPSEGSTVGISLVSTMNEWDKAIDECLKYDKTVLVEEYVEGDEITVGLLLGKALPPVEIKYPGKMYDYDAKYTHTKGETFYYCPPKNVSEEHQKKAREIAMKFFEVTGARDMLRVDMIVTRDGRIYVLEGNNLPGFTSSSLLPKAAKASGISFVQLCSMLALSAAQRI